MLQPSIRDKSSIFCIMSLEILFILEGKCFYFDIFQRDAGSKAASPRRGEYNVYSTFQSHEPEFDYLKSLEIEEKINKIRWLKRKNPAHFLLSTNGMLFFTYICS